MDSSKQQNKSRRNFLKHFSVFSLIGAMAAQLWVFFRFLLPDGLAKPPHRHKIGPPEKFREGITFLDDLRVFIVRKENRLYAISAICTHLGCTVKKTISSDALSDSDVEFDCPCHGSKFHQNGVNFAGPARKPLERYFLSLSPKDGQLVVDIKKKMDSSFSLIL